MAEGQLWIGLATGLLAYFVGKVETLDDGQHGGNGEHLRPLLDVGMQYATIAATHNGVHLAWWWKRGKNIEIILQTDSQPTEK